MFMRAHRKAILVVALVIWAALFVAVGPASAHILDSDLVVNGVRLGPYRLSVWTVSSFADAITVHLSARLSHAVADNPVMAARVAYTLENLTTGAEAVSYPASPAMPANNFLYESSDGLSEPGRYRVTVHVADGTEFDGGVTYEINVFPPSPWLKILVSVLLASGVAAMLWMLREGTRTFNKMKRGVSDDNV